MDLLNELEEEITCIICFEIFVDPHMLPCIHSFCGECVKGIQGNKPRITCPVCKAEYEDKSVKPNVNMKNMVEFYSKAKAIGQVDKQMWSTCDICEDKGTIAECATCHVKLCNGCSIGHVKYTGTTDHQITIKPHAYQGSQLLKREITCVKCCNIYDNPKVLQCGHTFCENDLDFFTKRKVPVECYQCGKTYQKENVTSNFQMQNLIDIYIKLNGKEKQKSSSDYEFGCMLCEIEPSTQVCYDCELLFCDGCAHGHNKYQSSKDHEVLVPTNIVEAGKAIAMLEYLHSEKEKWSTIIANFEINSPLAVSTRAHFHNAFNIHHARQNLMEISALHSYAQKQLKSLKPIITNERKPRITSDTYVASKELYAYKVSGQRVSAHTGKARKRSARKRCTKKVSAPKTSEVATRTNIKEVRQNKNMCQSSETPIESSSIVGQTKTNGFKNNMCRLFDKHFILYYQVAFNRRYIVRMDVRNYNYKSFLAAIDERVNNIHWSVGIGYLF